MEIKQIEYLVQQWNQHVKIHTPFLPANYKGALVHDLADAGTREDEK